MNVTTTVTVVIPAAPAKILDINGNAVTNDDIIALVAPADFFDGMDISFTSLTKSQLWRMADVVTYPGIDNATRLELIQTIRGEKAAARKAAAAAKKAQEAAPSNVIPLRAAA